jgi:hypothetical protein
MTYKLALTGELAKDPNIWMNFVLGLRAAYGLNAWSSVAKDIISAELHKYNAVWTLWLEVEFETEEDFLVFKLKFS